MRTIKTILFTLLLFAFNTAIAQQTFTISGVVTDKNNKTLPGATVFVADSRKVTISDGNGAFVLNNMKPGSYKLVVKMIGFEIIEHEFTLQNKGARFRFKLVEDNTLLGEVNISGMTDAERKGYLARFIKGFLGNSANAAQCKILNTDIIKFKFDRKANTLTAYTKDFLEIENKALGYHLKFLLSNFTGKSEWGNYEISFYGTLYFEDMKGSERQQKKWEQARADAYLGSLPHFFRSAFNNTLTENGFEAYQMLNSEALKVYKKKLQLPPFKYYLPLGSLNKFLIPVDSTFKKLDLHALTKDSTVLYVVYTPKNEPDDFKQKGDLIPRFFPMPAGQTSVLHPMLDSVLVDRSGYLSPTNGLLLMGYWSWGQMSTFLPTDYEVPSGKMPVIKKINRKPLGGLINNNPPGITIRPGSRP